MWGSLGWEYTDRHGEHERGDDREYDDGLGDDDGHHRGSLDVGYRGGEHFDGGLIDFRRDRAQ